MQIVWPHRDRPATYPPLSDLPASGTARRRGRRGCRV